MARINTKLSLQAPEEINIPLHKICPNCEAKLEVDVIPEKYFRFLKYRP